MRTTQEGRKILSRQEWNRVGLALRLSGREFELLRCCFDDLSEPEIAHALGISPHTVHTYMKRLFRKAGASSRVELIVRSVAEILPDAKSGDGAGGDAASGSRIS